MTIRSAALSCAAIALCASLSSAQNPAPNAPPPPREPLNRAPARRADEGRGPFKTLVIRGAILIDGTGAPPVGPVDIVIEQQPHPGGAQRRHARPAAAAEAGAAEAEHEIDATGMYVLPGFVSLHEHAGGAPKNPDAEYPFKLWLAHGVTTVVGVPLTDHALTVSRARAQQPQRDRRAAASSTSSAPGSGWDKGAVDTPDAAREWVRWAAANGVEGLKLGAQRPEIMAALLDEAKKHKLGSTAHLQQTGVAQMNALDAAQLGLRTVTHFYGHFEALLKDYVVQPWPVDQVNDDEQMRFGQVARLWDKIHPPGSPEWKAYLQEHRKLGTTFDPTMTAYAAGPRPDADAQRRLARAVHAAVADGLLHAEPHQPRLLLLRLDARRRDRLAQLLPGLVPAAERLQEDGRPRHRERRRGVHLQHLRLRQHPRARAAAGGRLPSARGDPGRHATTRP